jgi:hypothetical protein
VAERHLKAVARPIDEAQKRVRFGTVKLRIDVDTSGEQNSVRALEVGLRQLRRQVADHQR